MAEKGERDGNDPYKNNRGNFVYFLTCHPLGFAGIIKLSVAALYKALEKTQKYGPAAPCRPKIRRTKQWKE